MILTYWHVGKRIVEQEQNGLYTYEREAKFDADSIRTINARKAAIEQ